MYRTTLKRVVVEGGPGAGKTGVIARLHELGHLTQFQIVPELATILFGGFKARIPEEPDLLRRFNHEFLDFQLKLETMGMIHARGAGKLGLIMDRGLLTRLAFPGIEPHEFLRGTGMTETMALNREDLIIFMDMPSRDVYDTCREKNPERAETYEEAISSGEISRKLWGRHPNCKVIPGKIPWEDRVTLVAKALNDLIL